MNYTQLVELCNSDIRSGRPQAVAQRFAKLTPARVPRQWRLPLAKICRRAGLYSMGLSLLNPLMHPTSLRTDLNATPPEIAEYAILLLRYGAVTEAIEHLNRVDAERVPDALHFRAVWHFIHWDYAGAIPHLESYIKNPPSPDANLVGRTNLAFAHVECRHHKTALAMLEENIELAERLGHRQLQGNNHAFRGQVYLQDGKFSRARSELDEAQKLFALANTNDHFVIVKLQLILEALEKQKLEPLNRLRDMATRRNDWETVREADLFALKIKFDMKNFLHLYFGTPYEKFRVRMCSELERQTDRELYILGPKAAPRFDFVTGEITGMSADLRPGQKCHRLIQALLKDFYQPLRVGSMFASLYPDEHFNISSSPDRLHQNIRRTRKWLESEKIPVRIDEAQGFYSMVLEGDFSFRVPLNRELRTAEEVNLGRLKTHFGRKHFSSRAACEALDLSKSSMNRLLNWAIKMGRLERLGDANSQASYRMIVSS